MKSINYVSILALISLSYWLVAARSGDVMTELTIETTKLQQDVLLNLKAESWFSFNATASMRQIARRIPESSRAITVRALGKVVRTYVESSTFRTAWLQDLQSYYPYDATYSEENLTKKKQVSDAEKRSLTGQMASMEQAFARIDPAMLQMAIRAQLSQEEEKLASLFGDQRIRQKQHIVELKKMLLLSPAAFKRHYLASIKQQAQANINQSDTSPDVDKDRLAEYHKQKAAFDAHTDFRPLLKQRLQDFITLTETVDFKARLVQKGYKQEFANPVYQHKSAEWKFLYRLGEESVTEARLVAQQWLSELP